MNEEKEVEGVRLINLTPHEVTIMGEDNHPVLTLPSESVLRLSEKRTKVGEVSKIPVFRKEFGGTELPPCREGVFYIVSLPVAQAFPEREDFLIPDELVRDERGRVIGARAFATLAHDSARGGD